MKAFKYRRPNGRINTLMGDLCTRIRDKNGEEIFEGDTLRFCDKAEWYKSDLFKMWCDDVSVAKRTAWLAEQPFEERLIEMPQCFEWLLSSEIQTYWEIKKP